MKILAIMWSAMFISSAAWGDARIESDSTGAGYGENVFHAPYSSYDTDNEYKNSSGRIIVFEEVVDSNTIASAKANYSMYLPVSMMPPELRNNDGTIVVSSDTTGESCTIKSDNRYFRSDNWTSRIERKESKIIMTVICLEGN